MRKSALLAALVVCAAANGTHAAIVGPVYPAPGGTTFSSSGAATLGHAGGRVFNYSGLDRSQYGDLYWGLQNIANSVLNGGNIAGPGAQQQSLSTVQLLSGSTVFDLAFGDVTLQTRTAITPASPGILMFSPLGMNGSEGFAFKLNPGQTSFSVRIEMQTFWNGIAPVGFTNPAAGWYGTNDLYNMLNTRGAGTTTSAQGGLWYSELPPTNASVPEPATLLAWSGFGLVGLAFRTLRRRQKLNR